MAALEGERGQGTVEYVSLILLVALLMVDMVAAMKGFNEPRLLGGYRRPAVEVPGRPVAARAYAGSGRSRSTRSRAGRPSNMGMTSGR